MSFPLSVSTPSWRPAIWSPDASSSRPTPFSSSPEHSGILSTSALSMHGSLPNQTTRQWNFTAFEWTVNDVKALCETIEHSSAPEGSAERVHEDEPFEILREHPSIGDGKFILEIARTPAQPRIPTTPLEGPSRSCTTATRVGPQTLSLYITSLMDHTNMDSDMTASLLVAIKCVDERGSERGTPAEWVWENWEQNWCFRKESEFWECPLPPLSTLLENQNISLTESFVICVQIHSPVGPFVPQLPSAHYIPRDLLDGFEASLDNAHTGDVAFIVLERSGSLVQSAPQSPRSVSSRLSGSRPQTARKRVIYAHSDILKSRSNYFHTMLNSAFSEASYILSKERKIYKIVVEDADYISVYWLLKWVYTNWIHFKEEDDPRVVFDTAVGSLSAQRLAGGVAEWEWRTLIRADPSADSVGSRDDIDSDVRAARSVASVESLPSVAPARHTVESIAERTTPGPDPIRRVPSTPITGNDGFSRVHAAVSTRPTSIPTSTSRKPSAIPIPTSTGSPNTGFVKRNPQPRPSKSPHLPRFPSHNLNTDPHPHPAGQPPPASALSIYKIAHRYLLPGLSNLALDHMLSTITPQSAFPLLLASHFWDDLHYLIEDYIVEHWDLVSQQDDFESCCEEVAAGEWGPHGGKTLAGLFRRLRSPSITNLAWYPYWFHEIGDSVIEQAKAEYEALMKVDLFPRDPDYRIVDIPGKGKGVIAKRRLARGQLIFSEAPIFLYNIDIKPVGLAQFYLCRVHSSPSYNVS
ncbi:hypothetical protein DACRYDRAFT_18333 [Dacryopinax primogenitus]|uniref:BTB domain-containing protein n=1 Tax=Dacryopinax primogenitus (strain DJM 731) TaxID=1858805 RepID=M5G1X8_DACPD|nr:uncharacterized protein DACRYDRAFT_18333 [Dacryopinax primogenitus]EJT97762.1 hypothetical protein DACRYDRAFT_18333 [Dacryopinax primogenitus]